MKSTQCTIHILTQDVICAAWNTERAPETQYDDGILHALIARFECPDSRYRWDAPLFSVAPDDSLPTDAIFTALYETPKQGQEGWAWVLCHGDGAYL